MDITTSVHVTDFKDKVEQMITFDEFVEEVCKSEFSDDDLRVYGAALQLTMVDLLNAIGESEPLSRRQLAAISILLREVGTKLSKVLNQNFDELLDANGEKVAEDFYGSSDEDDHTILGSLDDLPDELVEMLKKAIGKNRIIGVNIIAAE